jgi:AraC family transcriptional regulator of adaptative response/methylated-DNA-[protein]-cysteine methyltransferase
MPSSDSSLQTMTLLPPREVMYRAFVDRDPSFEGVFVAGVTTTGIFCRPTCPARKPAPDHVEFFCDAYEALAAGYRPCLRCDPDGKKATVPDGVLRLKEAIETSPNGRLSDKELAALSIDPATARRQFLRHYGITFQDYQRARRLGAALQEVRRGNGVAAARAAAGFESESGFREAFVRMFGATPGAAVGTDCIVVDRLETPLGAMIAAADDEGLRLLVFGNAAEMESEIGRLRRLLKKAVVPGDHAHIAQVREELTRYFEGDTAEFTVPLAPAGSEFQLRTWELLRSIPPGETRSYSWMADRLGLAGARRAVGRANGSNPLCIVIPCHRVIRADGTLCGYGGGVWRKRWLLRHERRWAPERVQPG